MIRNRLSVLLAERGLKATKVSNDTGIAKSTLSKITNNSSEKIDYSTINTLCRYLRITPCDFFEYEPLDVSFFVDISDKLLYDPKEEPLTYKVEAYLNIDEDSEKKTFEYVGQMIDFGSFQDGQQVVRLDLEPISKKEADRLVLFFSNIKPSFITDIHSKFEKEVRRALDAKGYTQVLNDAVDISLMMKNSK